MTEPEESSPQRGLRAGTLKKGMLGDEQRGGLGGPLKEKREKKG